MSQKGKLLVNWCQGTKKGLNACDEITGALLEKTVAVSEDIVMMSWGLIWFCIMCCSRQSMDKGQSGQVVNR